MKNSVHLSLFLALLSLTGCRDNQITTIKVPKEEAPAAATASGSPAPAAPGAGPSIQWKVPQGWEEVPASNMRVGSFLVTGQTAEEVDISVIPLAGDAGGDLANINRWRDQIGLPELSPAQLKANSREIFPAGRRMRLVEFSNNNKRVIAAIYTRPTKSWFFKMTGGDKAVKNQKAPFLKFLESLRFPSEE